MMGFLRSNHKQESTSLLLLEFEPAYNEIEAEF